MIQKLSHTTIYVLDQERAKRFYTEKLGFEVRQDAQVPGVPMRWLTVGPKGQPDLQLVLMDVKSCEAMMDPESARMLRQLVERGAMGAGVFQTADIAKTFEELKAKGVAVHQPPTERPYGIEAVIADDSGNWFSLTQPR
jgi:predicted enzyme related to lactoylglutathione lyase